MIDEIAEMKRFGQHLRITHLLARTHRDSRKAGDEEDLQIGIDLVRLSGNLDAIDAGHHNIGNQKVVGAFVDGIQGRQPVRHGRHFMAAAFERALEKLAHGLVVFGKQYSRHGFRTLIPVSQTVGPATNSVARDSGILIRTSFQSMNILPGIMARTVKGDRVCGFRYIKLVMDRETVNDSDAAIEILAPAEQRVPLVFSSPHSGRDYPADFLAASKLDAMAIRRSEDSFVDELFSHVPYHGAPLLKALFPRAFVDPNREPYELDPSMFRQPLPKFVNRRSPRVAAGLGTIARVVASGAEIYSCKLDFEEVVARIERCYRPYHEALEDLITQTRTMFGTCILIDCHSMPSIGGPMENDAGRRRQVDFILGDAHGRACARPLTMLVEETLRGMGYSVVRNTPYSGGFITRNYGRPERGVHALQIEINRALYMDETTFERTAGLAKVTSDMNDLAARLVELEPAALAA